MPLLPVAMYGLEVPTGGVLIPAIADFPATFRITMAAIDPDEKVETAGVRPRATLKIVKANEDDDSEDEANSGLARAILAEPSSDESESESDDQETNGGPSDPAKSKKAKQQAAMKQLVNSLGGSDSDEELNGATNGINGIKKVDKKGKGKASSDEEESEEESDGDDVEFEEFVLCTLDPEKNFQQAIDITIGENEPIFFKASGTHTIYLTGNYVLPDDGHNPHHEVYDSDEEEDGDYDLSPDEDELEIEMDEDESDELDDIEDPRITEVPTDEEEAPKLVAKAEAKSDKKGKNKRSADDISSSATLDDIMAKALKPAPESTEEPKLSKKQLKKLKKNNGEAVGVKTEEAKHSEATKKDETKPDKKVQFAKNLEQGPTGSAEKKVKAEEKAKGEPTTNGKTTLGVKTVQGVQLDDKKTGSGPGCKKGNTVSMRYIGKLTNGSVFDSNKSGKAFSFKLGAGEVIKGWDIGVAGMSIGGERRLTIPANLAYGNKALPGIPANSPLIFDIKLLALK